jgi:hypothetical protein
VTKSKKTLKSVEVFVDDVPWTSVDSLSGSRPGDLHFIVSTDDRIAHVTFGDGKNGAIPASGKLRVVATYKLGSGRQGNVGAGSIALLLTPPTGVRRVQNPLGASGGRDAEAVDPIRENVPRSMLRADEASEQRGFARVRQQQGRVQLDSDWNEASPTIEQLLRILLSEGESWSEERQLAMLQLIRDLIRLLQPQ